MDLQHELEHMKNFTPKIGILVVVVILVISGVIMVANRDKRATVTSSASNSSTLAANAQKTGDIGEYYDGTASGTSSPSATPVATPPPLSTYRYPGSASKSATLKKIEMESTEAPEKITDWYKNKIQTLNFNAKSFSQTNTGGNVLNKLTAAKPGEKLDITIKKDQTSSKVLITVDRP